MQKLHATIAHETTSKIITLRELNAIIAYEITALRILELTGQWPGAALVCLPRHGMQRIFRTFTHQWAALTDRQLDTFRPLCMKADTDW